MQDTLSFSWSGFKKIPPLERQGCNKVLSRGWGVGPKGLKHFFSILMGV